MAQITVYLPKTPKAVQDWFANLGLAIGDIVRLGGRPRLANEELARRIREAITTGMSQGKLIMALQEEFEIIDERNLRRRIKTIERKMGVSLTSRPGPRPRHKPRAERRGTPYRSSNESTKISSKTTDATLHKGDSG